MRILKNILIYALPALMLCNTSCDYLDKEPENKVPEENVDFTQIENMCFSAACALSCASQFWR